MVKVVSKKDQARKKKKKIFRDVKTGRPSGITRGGRTFLGLSPEDVDVIAKDTRSPTDEEIKEKNKQLDAEESEVKSTLKLKPLGQTKEDGEKGFFGKTVEKVKEISDKFNLEKASGEEIQTGTIPIGPAGLFAGGAAAGIKAGPSIAEKGTTKAITFSSFLTKNYKNLDKADNILKVERSIQRLQKTFKIDRSAAIKIGKEFGTLKKKDMIQLLGKPNANALKTPLKTVGKIAAGLVGADTLISWLSVDNIIQGAAIFARDTASAVTFGGLDPQSGLDALDETQESVNIANDYVTKFTEVRPTYWIFGRQIKAAAAIGNNAIELQRFNIEQALKGGN